MFVNVLERGGNRSAALVRKRVEIRAAEQILALHHVEIARVSELERVLVPKKKRRRDRRVHQHGVALMLGGPSAVHFIFERSCALLG